MSNKKPITVTTIDYSVNDGEEIETVVMVSYAEAIRINHDIMNMYHGEDLFCLKERVEILDDIIRYTIKKIKQDHCE